MKISKSMATHGGSLVGHYDYVDKLSNVSTTLVISYRSLKEAYSTTLRDFPDVKFAFSIEDSPADSCQETGLNRNFRKQHLL